MSVEVRCPQGHKLHAREKDRGKTGRCPKCGAPVAIPADSDPLPDDEIAEMLGVQKRVAKPPRNEQADHDDPEHIFGEDQSTAEERPASSSGTRTKLCPKCHDEILAGYTVCPNCQTYLSVSGKDILKPSSGVSIAAGSSPNRFSLDCPECGAKTFPGERVCHNCGATVKAR